MTSAHFESVDWKSEFIEVNDLLIKTREKYKSLKSDMIDLNNCFNEDFQISQDSLFKSEQKCAELSLENAELKEIINSIKDQLNHSEVSFSAHIEDNVVLNAKITDLEKLNKELNDQIQTSTVTYSEQLDAYEDSNASLLAQVTALEIERDILSAKCTSFQADLVSARNEIASFTERTRVLDTILESQRSPSSRQGLGFVVDSNPSATTTFVPPESSSGLLPSPEISPPVDVRTRNSRQSSGRVFHCDHCGRNGHTSLFCWDLKKTSRKSKSTVPLPSRMQEPTPVSRVFHCSNCGRLGHTSPFCWDLDCHSFSQSHRTYPPMSNDSRWHLPYSWDVHPPHLNSNPVYLFPPFSSPPRRRSPRTWNSQRRDYPSSQGNKFQRHPCFEHRVTSPPSHPTSSRSRLNGRSRMVWVPVSNGRLHGPPVGPPPSS
jgi:hypothetical protein